MKIQASGDKRYFPPANRCIYCGRRGIPLTQEHIIPFALGGNFIIPKASCSRCQKTINRFEAPLLRGHFYPARVHLGFPTRHRDPRPEAFHVKFTDDGTTATVPLANHSCVIYLPKFVDEPKILTGTPPDDKIQAGKWLYVFQLDLHRRMSRFGGRAVEPATPMRFDDFVRLLAKIGHSFAVAELGEGKFKPLALGLIQGDMANPDLLVGGIRDTLQPKPDFHDIWLASYQSQHGHYLVANVLLFASLQGPIYRVVVGEFETGSPGLARRVQTAPQ